MIFRYDELREYVWEDCERFLQMRFTEKQMLPAVLNEYEHGEGYCWTECVCIHVILAVFLKKNNMQFDEISAEVKKLLKQSEDNKIKDELGGDYFNFMTDVKFVMYDTYI